jgi:hypothetical protein
MVPIKNVFRPLYTVPELDPKGFSQADHDARSRTVVVATENFNIQNRTFALRVRELLPAQDELRRAMRDGAERANMRTQRIDNLENACTRAVADLDELNTRLAAAARAINGWRHGLDGNLQLNPGLQLLGNGYKRPVRQIHNTLNANRAIGDSILEALHFHWQKPLHGECCNLSSQHTSSCTVSRTGHTVALGAPIRRPARRAMR